MGMLLGRRGVILVSGKRKSAPKGALTFAFWEDSYVGEDSARL